MTSSILLQKQEGGGTTLLQKNSHSQQNSSSASCSSSSKCSEMLIRLESAKHLPSLAQGLVTQFMSESMVDVTLVTEEGEFIHAHKVILASGSQYFKNVLEKASHLPAHLHQGGGPVIICLSGIKYASLYPLIKYLYTGRVDIPQNDLKALVKAAYHLQIKGLYDEEAEQEQEAQGRVEQMNKEEQEVKEEPEENGEDEEDQILLNPKAEVEEERGDLDGDGSPPPPPHCIAPEIQMGDGEDDDEDDEQQGLEDQEEYNKYLNEERLLGGGGDMMELEEEEDSSGDGDQHLQFDYEEGEGEGEEEDGMGSFSQQGLYGDEYASSTSTSGSRMRPPPQLIKASDLPTHHGVVKKQNGSFPYHCPNCGNGYTCSKSLWRHRKYNCNASLNKVTFICKICSKGFSRSDNLKRHTLVAHNIPGVGGGGGGGMI